MACFFLYIYNFKETDSRTFGCPFDYYGDSQKSITVFMRFKRVSSKNKVPYQAMITVDVSKYCLRL